MKNNRSPEITGLEKIPQALYKHMNESTCVTQRKHNARLPGNFDYIGDRSGRVTNPPRDGAKKTGPTVGPAQKTALRPMAPGHRGFHCIPHGNCCNPPAMAPKPYQLPLFRNRACSAGLAFILGIAGFQSPIARFSHRPSYRNQQTFTRRGRRRKAHRHHSTAYAPRCWTRCMVPKGCFSLPRHSTGGHPLPPPPLSCLCSSRIHTFDFQTFSPPS